MAQHPALAANTLQTVGQRLQEAHTRVIEMTTEEVERRIAHALLRLVKQAGRKVESGIEIDFPISRQDVAEMTGTTLHTVSRVLSAWEQQGLVESGRQRITVRDPHRLFGIAEGPPAAEPFAARALPPAARTGNPWRGPVLAAGVFHRVKSGDGAAHAVHPEIKEDADGRGPAPHHLVHRHLKADLRTRRWAWRGQ